MMVFQNHSLVSCLSWTARSTWLNCLHSTLSRPLSSYYWTCLLLTQQYYCF